MASGPHEGQPVVAHTVTDPAALKLVHDRLRRAQGQIGGVLSMIEQGRSCQEVVTQLAAVNKAVDKAAFVLIATGLRECLNDADGETDAVVEQLQKLFLSMA